MLTVFVAKQARAKAAPYPRQASASVHIPGASTRAYGSTPGRSFPTSRPVNRVVTCYRCGVRGHMAHQCYKAATSSSLPAAEASSRP